MRLAIDVASKKFEQAMAKREKMKSDEERRGACAPARWGGGMEEEGFDDDI
jgi:hypothetical protein